MRLILLTNTFTGAASPQCGGVTEGRGDTRGETELIIQTGSVVRDETWTLLHTNMALIVVTLHTNVLTKISGPSDILDYA